MIRLCHSNNFFLKKYCRYFLSLSHSFYLAGQTKQNGTIGQYNNAPILDPYLKKNIDVCIIRTYKEEHTRTSAYRNSDFPLLSRYDPNLDP